MSRSVSIRTSLLLVVVASFVRPAYATPINLIPNGDFSAGYTGFTSEYNAAPAGNTAALEYAVRANSLGWNPFFVDATDYSGAGLMLVANGPDDSDAVVWGTTFAVTPFTNYVFQGFGMNICCNDTYPGPGKTEFAELSWYANGVLVTAFSVGAPGVWISGSGVWNSGPVSSITLELINTHIAFSGNDFAIDNLFFADQAAVEAVPEPGTLSLTALALVAVAWRVRRRR